MNPFSRRWSRSSIGPTSTWVPPKTVVHQPEKIQTSNNFKARRSQWWCISLNPKTCNAFHNPQNSTQTLRLPIHLFSSSLNMDRVGWWRSISRKLLVAARCCKRPAKWSLRSGHRCRDARNRLIPRIASFSIDWRKLRARSPRRPGSSMQKAIIGRKRGFRVVRRRQRWCSSTCGRSTWMNATLWIADAESPIEKARVRAVGSTDVGWAAPLSLGPMANSSRDTTTPSRGPQISGTAAPRSNKPKTWLSITTRNTSRSIPMARNTTWMPQENRSATLLLLNLSPCPKAPSIRICKRSAETTRKTIFTGWRWEVDLPRMPTRALARPSRWPTRKALTL